MSGARRDAEIGRTLAETAALNAPERVAGQDAADTVRRVSGDRTTIQARQRRFRRALAILVLSIAGLAGLLAVLDGQFG